MRAASKYTRDYYLRSRIRKVLFWVISVTLTVALAYGYAFYFGQNIVVQESSMDPTLGGGRRGIRCWWTGRLISWDLPNGGDIIVFRTSDDPKASLHIKRVIGLPGETIQIRNGQILIDGETYVEKRDFPAITNPGIAEEPVYLGRGEYFVLGDNRNNSEDSRYADIGPIEKKRIVGKLWMVTAPFEKFGLLHH